MAARAGRRATLAFLLGMDPTPPLSPAVAAVAAARGDLALLAWLRSDAVGCPWDAHTVTKAAEAGHVGVLRWARAQTPPCRWDDVVVTWRDAAGSLRLQWQACARAARHGRLEALKWLRAQRPPCPWGEAAARGAAEGLHAETLRWLIESGCPWDADEVERAVADAVAGGEAVGGVKASAVPSRAVGGGSPPPRGSVRRGERNSQFAPPPAPTGPPTGALRRGSTPPGAGKGGVGAADGRAARAAALLAWVRAERARQEAVGAADGARGVGARGRRGDRRRRAEDGGDAEAGRRDPRRAADLGRPGVDGLRAAPDRDEDVEAVGGRRVGTGIDRIDALARAALGPRARAPEGEVPRPRLRSASALGEGARPSRIRAMVLAWRAHTTAAVLRRTVAAVADGTVAVGTAADGGRPVERQNAGRGGGQDVGQRPAAASGPLLPIRWRFRGRGMEALRGGGKACEQGQG
jgi:hypothetical protein